jgi:hypothetical protein
MLNANKLRVSLALVTLAGAFHLDRAEAAAPMQADCYSYANGYATGFCAATGGKPSSVTFTCNDDGTASIVDVKCIQPN